MNNYAGPTLSSIALANLAEVIAPLILEYFMIEEKIAYLWKTFTNPKKGNEIEEFSKFNALYIVFFNEFPC